MLDKNLRFHGVERLYGKTAYQKISSAHILVVGIGGVGSWIIEGLVRTGVGSLTFVDLDEICVSNINRQIHALSNTIGKSKVEVMHERLLQINPDVKLNPIYDFYTDKTSDTILAHDYDYVIDAIDSLHSKIHLTLECKKRNLSHLMIGGAGGKCDLSLIKVQDLSEAIQDPLLFRVRKKLRMDYGYPHASQKKGERTRKMKIDCVSSSEQIHYGSCEVKNASGGKLDCNGSLGAASFVTGSFAFHACHFVISKIISKID